MSVIKGIPVVLYTKVANGYDEFNKQKWTETAVTVNNVLVGEPSHSEILDTINLHGRRAQYTLAIPKTDNHDWENAKVSFFGQNWRTFGIPVQGIADNIPLDWNRKVWVERYE